MQIDIKLKKEIFVPKFLPYLQDYSHRWEFYMGSAGSGKSVFIHQKLIFRALREPGVRILICRKTASSARETTFEECKGVLTKWKLIDYVQINKTDKTIEFPNGSKLIFMGLDTETRLLSLADISCIFVEEAYEVEQNFVEQLNLRMRGKQPNQQLILAWNPISQHSWLYDFTVVNPPASSIFIHSTYKDNPFLQEAYIKELEELYVRNPARARVFCDGEWGIDPEGLVFTNWRVEDFDVATIAQKFERRAGLDFGFKDPAAIVDSFYDKDSRTIYVVGNWYKTGQTLEAYAKALKDMELTKTKVFSDSASPTDIATLREQGCNLVPCTKGAGSVEAGIRFLQDNTLIIHSSCQDVIRELENFSYIKDKTTGAYTEKMTHEFSHSIDALRYAYSDIYMGTGITVLDKKLFGL